MLVKVDEIKLALDKIAEFTNNEKAVPGIKLEVDGDILKVCYNDNKRAVISKIGVEVEEGEEIPENIVVNNTTFMDAIKKCLPSGRIVVDYISIRVLDGVRLEVSAEQKLLISDEEDEEEEYRVMSVKRMTLRWEKAGASMKTAILSRMKYESIFEAVNPDEWECGELIDILSKTTTEKGKIVYMSPSIQKAFVANLAHVTCVPISQIEVSPLDITSVEQQLRSEGKTDEEVASALGKLGNRLKNAATISTTVAKQVCGILTKIGKDKKVFMYTRDGFVNIFDEDETSGVWFEMAQGNKAQMSQFEKYSSLEYKKYQIEFAREFIVDNINSAISSTSSDKLQFMFAENGEDDLEVKIVASNSAASIEDKYEIHASSFIDTTGTLDGKKMTVSLKVFNDMLNQLSTDFIAMDIEEAIDGTMFVRLADIDEDKLREEYFKTRESLGLTDVEPTPDEEKMSYRARTLGTCQYTMISK